MKYVQAFWTDTMKIIKKLLANLTRKENMWNIFKGQTLNSYTL